MSDRVLNLPGGGTWTISPYETRPNVPPAITDGSGSSVAPASPLPPDWSTLPDPELWYRISGAQPVEKLAAMAGADLGHWIEALAQKSDLVGALNAHDAPGWTPLFRAVMGEHESAASALVAAGADPRTTQTLRAFPFSFSSPFSLAVERRELDLLSVLLTSTLFTQHDLHEMHAGTGLQGDEDALAFLEAVERACRDRGFEPPPTVHQTRPRGWVF